MKEKKKKKNMKWNTFASGVRVIVYFSPAELCYFLFHMCWVVFLSIFFSLFFDDSLPLLRFDCARSFVKPF